MLSFHPDYLLISITAKKVSLVIGTGGAGKLSENTSKQNVIITHTPPLKIQHICQA